MIDVIIDNSNPQENHLQWFPGDDLFTPIVRKKGLPIGNLTSQFWGNVYLNRFDHFVKEQLGVPGYVRYVDDFVLLGHKKEQLREWIREIIAYLGKLRLLPHPDKTQIHLTKDGIPFLGFQVFPHYRTPILLFRSWNQNSVASVFAERHRKNKHPLSPP